ncbi:ABC transporter substrate-binding protein [Nocardiopsis sp. CT-R113]|uniref:ABC transporter substrate-binding protein n=1 Tax=Nocardiopsis codii TaxID=3065942 RepID=A0ABU7KAL5_9ACTN|nr:ABC transporter substrate-binding protein [Nocardiopsis sp. CT-R113]MEE2039052.1 ABC transporter substrate-binding protein [Nocardiopsis sp. CT-R113]
MPRLSQLSLAATCSSVLLLTACTGGSTVDDDVEGADAGAGSLTSINAGYVSAIDQIGLPIGTEQGLFEERNLDVTLAEPFPTGVDAINALEAGDVDIIQVGTPAIAAAQEGAELSLIGNYTGSATQRSIDETAAIVAAEGSEIDSEDLSTLEGKSIGVSVGSINHLYLLGLLEDLRIDTDDVELVNTAPPDMAVALETGGIDAAVIWDPWPITITEQVEGSEIILRGGGYIPFIGYIVTTPTFLEENPEAVEEFLAARAASDQWIRENPEDAASSAVQWLTGTDPEVAQEAMQYNVAQLDPRFSACNYLALDTVGQLLANQGQIDFDFDINDYFEPGPIVSVMEENPELFEDLAEIPQAAAVDADYNFVREIAQESCAV